MIPSVSDITHLLSNEIYLASLHVCPWCTAKCPPTPCVPSWCGSPGSTVRRRSACRTWCTPICNRHSAVRVPHLKYLNKIWYLCFMHIFFIWSINVYLCNLFWRIYSQMDSGLLRMWRCPPWPIPPPPMPLIPLHRSWCLYSRSCWSSLVWRLSFRWSSLCLRFLLGKFDQFSTNSGSNFRNSQR